MKPKSWITARQVLLWTLGSAAAGALIGLAVALFRGGPIETPTIAISVLFGLVVGLTAMICSVALFPRLARLAPPLRALLLGLALLSGSIAGSVAVLVFYPLFVVGELRQAVAVVALNAVLALVVGSVVVLYEGMRLRLQESLREVEEVRLVEARLREEAARAELAALQARINPHFFFNTLNTISSLVTEDPQKAEDVVATLSDLFRYTFRVAGAGLIMLAEEVEFTRGYLSIERERFEDRLRVEWDLDPASLSFPVPGLVLQPLVENAVGHGIAPRAEGGCVRIESSLVDGLLRVDVSDDGSGLGGDGAELIREGHGLGNIEQRLQAFYKGRASIVLGPRPDGPGTLARLLLPRPARGES